MKIDAADLPTVQLGDSSTVQLAQDVRAIGFPLSSLLGNSVKIVSGSVAGFVDVDGVTHLQIDGAVNPGNSGGPLVNEQGHVIGVVNAKLDGESISKVGFAVPIQYVKKILDSKAVKYSVAEQATRLSGPELADKLTPAVGFVEAKLGTEGYRSFRNFSISVTGTLSKTSPPGDRPRREAIQSELIIDSYGNLVDIRNQVDLPLLLGPVASLPFESLPRLAQNRWTKTENLILPLPAEMPHVVRESTNRFDPFEIGIDPRLFHPGFRFGPGTPFGSPRKQPETKMRMAMATQILNYEIRERKDNLVTILQTQSFQTEDDQDEFANLRIKTSSTLKFDIQQGLFVSREMRGNIKFKLGEDTWTFPVKLNYRLVDLDTLFADSKPTLKQDLITRPPVGLSDNQLDRFIRSTDEFEESELLEFLKLLANSTGTKERSKEISAAIVKVLESQNPSAAKPAIDALLNWEPAAATPYLIEGLQNANAFSKRSWMVKLGQTGDERAASMLCGSLGDSGRRAVAIAALQQLGTVAEGPVISMLENNLEDSRVAEACLDVLSEIGTDQSQTVIRQIVDQQSGWSPKSRAEKALSAIQSRIK